MREHSTVGVRVALGADRWAILALIFSRALRIVALGIAVGGGSR